MIRATKEDYEMMVLWAIAKQENNELKEKIVNLKSQIRAQERIGKKCRLYFAERFKDDDYNYMTASPIEYHTAASEPEKIQYIVEKTGRVIQLRIKELAF